MRPPVGSDGDEASGLVPASMDKEEGAHRSPSTGWGEVSFFPVAEAIGPHLYCASQGRRPRHHGARDHLDVDGHAHSAGGAGSPLGRSYSRNQGSGSGERSTRALFSRVQCREASARARQATTTPPTSRSVSLSES